MALLSPLGIALGLNLPPAQVAFNMFIPCMLFTKVASTLAAQPHASLLAIPAVAVLQASMRAWQRSPRKKLPPWFSFLKVSSQGRDPPSHAGLFACMTGLQSAG